jgi:hypothetical protein
VHAEVFDEGREARMNLKKVNEILAEVEDGFMGGLMATDVFSRSSGMSVAGIRTNAKACALFNFLADRIVDSVKKSALPLPPDFEQLMLVFDGGIMLFVINLNPKYRWGMVVDTKRSSLGIAVSVVIPDCMGKLQDALT